MFVPNSPNAYKVYEQKNAINKDATLGHYFIDKDLYEELKGFAVQPEDIIVSCAGTIGETYVLPLNIREGIINQALMTIRLFDKTISDFYLLYFDFILKSEAAKESKGTAIKNIPPFDILKNFFIPLPPQKEQIRIIKEVSYWLSLVDTIDSEESEMSNLISRTKSKILDLATQGKLVPQDANDEPAIELLKRINPKFTPCDIAHYGNLPNGWCICRIRDLFQICMGQSPAGTSINQNDGMEFHQGKICFTDKFLGQSKILTNSPTKIADANSLLICVRAPVGVLNINTRQICIGRGLCALLPSKCVNLGFAFHCLTTYQQQFEQKSTGSTFKAISGDIIKNELFPLPPLAEQHRIVAKIEELFAQLDAIENSLQA